MLGKACPPHGGQAETADEASLGTFPMSVSKVSVMNQYMPAVLRASRHVLVRPTAIPYISHAERAERAAAGSTFRAKSVNRKTKIGKKKVWPQPV